MKRLIFKGLELEECNVLSYDERKKVVGGHCPSYIGCSNCCLGQVCVNDICDYPEDPHLIS